MSPPLAIVSFAQAWSMHEDDVGFGWWLVMTLGMIAFWGAILVLVVWLLRSGTARNRFSALPPDETAPHAILDRRLADGSLSVEGYERRRRLLDEAAVERPPHADRAGEATRLGADR